MATATVSVVIPTPGATSLIERSLPPLLEIRDLELEIVIVNTNPLIRLTEWSTRWSDACVRIVETSGSAGFCHAVNRGFHTTSGEFVFVCNDDLLVSPGYLSLIVDLLRRRPTAALATGKILRYDLERGRPTGEIDSAGLTVGRNRRFRDRGEGHRDDGRFDHEEQVFGVSGAGFVGRRSALDTLVMNGELLDESFYMYKEDCDLSWRARIMGWECWYIPNAVAYHGRTSRGAGSSYLSDPLAFVRGQRAKPQYVRINSMKNQWLMLVKNEDIANLRQDLLHVLGREALVFGHNVLLAPRSLVAIPRFLRALPGALSKRRTLKRRQNVQPATIREWWAGPHDVR